MMGDTLLMVLRGLDTLKTPLILLLVVLVTIGSMKLKRIQEQLRELKDSKADLHALNGVRGVLNKVKEEIGHESSQTRIAVAGLATKINAPEVLKEFLKKQG